MFHFFKKKNKNKTNLPKRMWRNEELTEKEIKKYKDVESQISGKVFIEILNDYLIPYVKSIGFKGSKNNFYKKNTPWIYTIQIHKDKYGGSCTLNVGVHLDFIEDIYDAHPVPSKFRLQNCIIKKNIPMSNGNSWFFYGINEKEGFETVALMKKMFQETAVPFLKQFENYPYPFDEVSYQDLVQPSDKFDSFGITENKLRWIHFQIFLIKLHLREENYGIAEKIIEKIWKEQVNDTSGSPFLECIEVLRKRLPT